MRRRVGNSAFEYQKESIGTSVRKTIVNTLPLTCLFPGVLSEVHREGDELEPDRDEQGLRESGSAAHGPDHPAQGAAARQVLPGASL